jgi:hypothetical protein
MGLGIVWSEAELRPNRVPAHGISCHPNPIGQPCHSGQSPAVLALVRLYPPLGGYRLVEVRDSSPAQVIDRHPGGLGCV